MRWSTRTFIEKVSQIRCQLVVPGLSLKMSWASDLYVAVAMIFIKLMVYAYEYLTLPIYFMFSKTEYFMPFPEDEQTYFKKFAAEESRTLSMPVDPNNPGSPWRAAEYIDNLATVALPGCPTLTDLWLRTVKLYPNKPALGTRRILKTDYEASDSMQISANLFSGFLIYAFTLAPSKW